jgi:peptidylprolyl isomerase
VGGDITEGNGTGGESIYGQVFADESFIVPHDEPGMLSMANFGPNSNSSQFFVTTAGATHLDGKHVVFGRVLEGYEVVKIIEKLGSVTGEPKSVVQVIDCGQLTGD